MDRCRLRVVSFALVLALLAPALSGQYPGCWTCKQIQDSDGYYLQGCAYPDDNSWGRETCKLEMWGTIEVCRTRGNGCYYFEVQG